jgi:hypothetical protein
MSRIRSLFVGIVALSLLALAAPVAAETAPSEEFFAESGADGVALSIMGSAVLEVSGTAAAATLGEAAALAVPAAIADEPVGERLAESAGATVRDPGDPADVCDIAVPAQVSAVLDLGVLCGEAEATGDVPEGWAEASAADVDVLSLDAAALEELADLLVELGIEDLLQQLTGAVAQDEYDRVLDDVLGPLQTECEAALEALDASIVDPLMGALDPVIEGISDADDTDTLRGLLEDAADLLGEDLPSACAALLDLLELDGEALAELVDLGSLREALLADGQALLGVQLLGTASEAGSDDVTIDAWAGGSAADAAVGLGLSLAGLGDVLEGLVAEALGDLQSVLDELVTGTSLEGELELTPLEDLVTQVFAQSDLLSGLLGDDLLSVQVAPGDAGVSYDRDSEEFATLADPALVELGGPLMELSDALNDLAGTVDEALLSELRASPLADLLEVSLLAASVEEDEVGGLPGVRATSGVASVTLLGAVDGGVSVEVMSSEAGVGYDTVDPVTTAGPDPEPAEPEQEQPLPVTGGAGLLLGLLALGGVTALRRRD